MIVGPFWCEEEKSWLRFVAENNKYVAQMASCNDAAHDRRTCHDWQQSLKDFWIIDYKAGCDSRCCEGLRLIDGILYRTEFLKNNLTKDLVVNTFDLTGRLCPHNINKFNPFAGKDKSLASDWDWIPITSYYSLPLAPEQQQEKKLKQNDDQRASDLPKEYWAAGNRTSLLEKTTHLSTFTKEQTHDLFYKLVPHLIELSPEHYKNHETYLTALEDVISKPDNPLNAKLIAFAAETYFDKEHDLNDDNDEQIRGELFERKQAFIYALLQTERELLLRFLKREIVPITNAPIKSLTTSNHVDTDEYSTIVTLAELKAAITELAEQLPSVPVVPTQQKSSQPTPLPQTLPTQQKPAHPTPLPQTSATQPKSSLKPPLSAQNKNSIQSIHDAVNKAVLKYEQWYKGKQDHRGSNGFFSWLRHGDEGQVRAKLFKKDILGFTTEQDAITYVNHFLSDPATRYHRHSLSSFLLDELIPLKELPWNGLVPDAKSNRYDAEQVVKRLNEFNGNTLRTQA